MLGHSESEALMSLFVEAMFFQRK